MSPLNLIRVAVKSIIKANSELIEKTKLFKRTNERVKKSKSMAIKGVLIEEIHRKVTEK